MGTPTSKGAGIEAGLPRMARVSQEWPWVSWKTPWVSREWPWMTLDVHGVCRVGAHDAC